jgi:hypothetical protein
MSTLSYEMVWGGMEDKNNNGTAWKAMILVGVWHLRFIFKREENHLNKNLSGSLLRPNNGLLSMKFHM